MARSRGPRRARRPRPHHHAQPARQAQRLQRRGALPPVRRVGPARRRPGAAGRHHDRRRRQLLGRGRPRPPRRRPHVGQAGGGRVRGADPAGLHAHLQGVPQGPLRPEADRRRGRGLLLRRRHGDPPGLRHPRRGRERAARHLRGAAGPVPDVGQHDPPAPPDPLHGGHGHAPGRRPDHRASGPTRWAWPATSPATARPCRPRWRWPTASPPTARSRCATSRRR